MFIFRGGIQKNLIHFDKLGVKPDEVVVLVMQDGIEKINDNVIENVFDKIDLANAHK